MAPTTTLPVAVIDYRRQGMVLQWNPFEGTWSGYDEPPATVHGIALIRASQPNICLYARGGTLQLQVGSRLFPLNGDSLRVKWSRDWASFGLRRRFTVESSAGEVLFSHAYWSNQGDEFFAWLIARTARPEWRAASARRWSEGVVPTVLRAS